MPRGAGSVHYSGSNCIVAQVRNGSVAVSVLPGLALGGCLVGVQD